MVSNHRFLGCAAFLALGVVVVGAISTAADRRLGGTQQEYDGSRRTQRMFGRFTCGFGCHYALGFCFDDKGDDTYGCGIQDNSYSRRSCNGGFLIDRPLQEEIDAEKASKAAKTDKPQNKDKS